MLDRVRQDYGKPMIINSGCRCSDENSAHFDGDAVDIRCTNSRDRYLIIHYLFEYGFNRIGIAKTFIHADISERKDPHVIWLY